MSAQLRFLGWIASIAGVFASAYLFLAVFSGRSGCRLSDIFAADCSGARTLALFPFVGAAVGIALLYWMLRGDEHERSAQAIVSLVYAAAVLVMFLAYASSMLGGMH